MGRSRGSDGPDTANTPDGSARRISAGVIRRGLAVLGLGIREEPRIFAVALFGSSLFAVGTVASSLILGQVTERVIIPSIEDRRAEWATVAVAVLVMTGVGLGRAVGLFIRRLVTGMMQYRLQATYRRRVTRQYLRLPLAWHQRHPTGTLLSNANADVEAAWAPVAPLPFAAGVIVMLVVALALLIATDPLLALIGCVVFPLVAAFNFFYGRRVSPLYARVQQLRAEVSGVAHESFDGALVVKTLGREADETARFDASARELRDAMIRAGRLRGMFDPVMEALPNIGVLLVVVVGAVRINNGSLSVGELVQVAYLFTLLAFPIRSIGWVLGELPRSVVGFDRVERVLRARGEQTYGKARLTGSGPAALSVRGVSYAYPAAAAGGHDTLGHDDPGDRDPDRDPGGDPGDRGRGGQAGRGGGTQAGTAASQQDGPARGEAGLPGEQASERPAALVDVSFEVPPGRVVALTGRTGSGKSTLTALLARLLDPDTGAVCLDGVDLRELAPGEVTRAVALVPQQTFLFDDTVRANVALGLDVSDEQIWDALRRAEAHRFVAALPDGLDTRVGERGTTLSGGQRQRIGLARALVRSPRLLILDDATSSVDPRVEAAILAGLRERAGASTVVIVAYRRSTIELADEVVHLENGRVAAQGRHADLLATSPGYAELLTAYEEAARAAARAAQAGGADRAERNGLPGLDELDGLDGLTALEDLAALREPDRADGPATAAPMATRVPDADGADVEEGR